MSKLQDVSSHFILRAGWGRARCRQVRFDSRMDEEFLIPCRWAAYAEMTVNKHVSVRLFASASILELKLVLPAP